MNKISILLFATSLTIVSSVSSAGVYTDELSKCLVSSTTAQDRVALVKWMFSAAASHPAVKDIVAITPEKIDQENQIIGKLFMRLISESCAKQTKEAIKYEGVMAIQGGFQVLGQVAGQEMFTSPEVANNMAGLQQYIDNDKIEALMK